MDETGEGGGGNELTGMIELAGEAQVEGEVGH